MIHPLKVKFAYIHDGKPSILNYNLADSSDRNRTHRMLLWALNQGVDVSITLQNADSTSEAAFDAAMREARQTAIAR